VSASALLSEPFRRTALAERDKLLELYEECRVRQQHHLVEANDAALAGERYLKTLRELGELLGVEDQLSIVELTDELRGQRLREVASQIVFSHFKPGEEFHYKVWFDLVVAAGHRIGGKNPAATFLTQVAQVDHVERVGKRTGIYRIAA